MLKNSNFKILVDNVSSIDIPEPHNQWTLAERPVFDPSRILLVDMFLFPKTHLIQEYYNYLVLLPRVIGYTSDISLIHPQVLELFNPLGIQAQPRAVHQFNGSDNLKLVGYSKCKHQLMQIATWFYQKRSEFEQLGIQPSKGTLLYGPPGNGKTFFAKTLASAMRVRFITIQMPQWVQGHVGESQKAIRDLFNSAKGEPTILFLDEIDSLFSSSSGLSAKVSSQLALELDNLTSEDRLMIIAATNLKEKVNKSILRPGRIDRHIYIGPPNYDDRQCILQSILDKMKIQNDINVQDVCEMTEGFSCSELNELMRRGAIEALQSPVLVNLHRIRH